MCYVNTCETIRLGPEHRVHSRPHSSSRSMKAKSIRLVGSNVYFCEQCFPLTSKPVSDDGEETNLLWSNWVLAFLPGFMKEYGPSQNWAELCRCQIGKHES